MNSTMDNDTGTSYTGGPNLEDFLTGYIECMLWAGLDWDDTEDSDPQPLYENYSADDITDEARATIRNECQDFYIGELADLAEAAAVLANRGHGNPWGALGHDFYLTRNGHGAGYWDRGLGAVGDRLTRACKPWGESGEYTADGQVHYD